MIQKNESCASFSVTKEALSRALARVSGAAEKRSSVPSLSQVRCVLKGAQISISATDTELLISEALPVKSAEGLECEFAVSASVLHDLVRKLDDEAIINCSLEKMRLVLVAGCCSFTLPCSDVADFPVIDDSGLSRKIEFTYSELISPLNRTKFAVSNETGRYNLSGCYVQMRSGVLNVVATDCHRLAYSSCNLASDFDFDFIMPKKAVIELSRIIKSSTVTLWLPQTNKISRVKFCFGDVAIISKVVAAEFPDYRRVVPESYTFTIKLDRHELARAVERVSVIFVDKVRSVKLKFSSKGSVELSTNTPDSSSAKEVLEVVEGGADLEIGLNFSYLLDVLANIESPKVVFSLIDESSAVMVADENAGKSWFYIVMPMSI